MLRKVSSAAPIEKIDYFLRSTGIADVYLHKNITNREDVMEEEQTGSQYEAEEVYFVITGEKASKEDIDADFDYWFEKASGLGQDELGDQFSLEELRQKKYVEVGTVCEKTIYSGVDVEISTGVEHFSLTEKDQINLFAKKMQLLARESRMEYHENGQLCRYFDAKDMQKIVDTAMFYVSYNTTYCNSLNMWIKAAKKPSDLEFIYWGADIPEEFQSVVLKDYMKILSGGAE
ncbi:MAG: hypothetical protein ACI4EO_01785 [Blautia sp.]